jgi:hypothetical protein
MSRWPWKSCQELALRQRRDCSSFTAHRKETETLDTRIFVGQRWGCCDNFSDRTGHAANYALPFGAGRGVYYANWLGTTRFVKNLAKLHNRSLGGRIRP